jgi:hypothetical protein
MGRSNIGAGVLTLSERAARKSGRWGGVLRVLSPLSMLHMPLTYCTDSLPFNQAPAGAESGLD